MCAGPGWGKSSFVAQYTNEQARGWLPWDPRHQDLGILTTDLLGLGGPPNVAGPSADALSDPSAIADQVAAAWAAAGLRTVVLDGASLPAGSPAQVLVRAVATARNRTTQLVVTSRQPLELVDPGERADGDVLELDAQTLALDLDAVASLVEQELSADRALAARVMDATGGWPAAIHLLLDALRAVPADQRSAAIDGALDAAGPVGSYLDAVVMPEESTSSRLLLARIAVLGSSERRLLGQLRDRPLDPTPEAGAGSKRIADQVDELVARGLARTDPEAADRIELAPVVRRFIQQRLVPTIDEGGTLTDELADALAKDGQIAAALELLSKAGRSVAVADLLLAHGNRLIHAGELALVDASAAGIDVSDRSPEIERIHAKALAFLGDWVSALRCLDASGVAGEGPLAPDVALQVGLVHHLQGDLEAALAAYDRAPPDRDHPAQASLRAWRSSVHWLRGELEQARTHGDAAMDAVIKGDDQGLALAHTAAALIAASDGDRHANEAHYRQALHAASRSGDRLQEARIRSNWGSHHLEEGNYTEALEETERAMDLAEQAGFAMMAGVALCNRSEILLLTGELDGAIADAERGRKIFAAVGDRTEAYAHRLLGAARAERGELGLAQTAYERAVRLARPAGDTQGLVPAYVGLAMVLASSDPDAAADAAEQALQLDDGRMWAEATLASAWVHAAKGDIEVARDLASGARETATERENQAIIAEATTCLAVVADDPMPLLRQARQLWSELQAPLWIARTDLGLARRSEDPQEQSRIPWLERRLASSGCLPDRGSIAHRLVMGTKGTPRLLVHTLGGFAVEREGRPLPAAAWGSRKAQDLFKILVIRSGRRTTREELAHLLWPDQPYEDVSNRLSVALSLARSAVSGEEDTPLITATAGSVRLEPDALDVDLVRFERLAAEGLRAARRDDPSPALGLLVQAEELYGGDLLEDEPDASWAQDRRVSLRASYLEVARSISKLSAEHDPDLAIRMLLRVLDRDGYDEPAHLNLCLALLRSGRHGEARRRFRIYEARMQELDLPAVPFHELTGELNGGPERAAS